MKLDIFLLAVASALMAGCGALPTEQDAVTGVADGGSSSAPAARSTTEALEQRHRERAHAYEAQSNWADALVQWNVLILLNPDSQEYRKAAEATRNRIRSATVGWSRAAEFARKQGNLEQATLLYLKVLNLDREDAAAAQALRDIDTERAQRAYLNRPPRGTGY